MRVRFVGECQINGEETKNPYVRSGKTSNGNNYEAFSCGIKAAKNNMAFVELFGSEQDTIKTMDSDNNKIEIDWEDRFDDDVLQQVANYKKNVIKINDDRKEFVSAYDAVDYLVKHVDDIKGQRIVVTGQSKKNIYKGKMTDRFELQNVYLAEETDKNGFKCNDTLYFSKDSFDSADWKDEHKLYINGWIKAYIADEKKNMYVPQTVVFDCSKIDFENEKHRKLVEFKLKMIGCSLTSDNKIKVNVGKSIYAMSVVLNYFNGAVAEEITLEDLTDAQKEAIELGIKNLSDFSGNVYGSRQVIFKLTDYNLAGEYDSGYTDTEISIKEFEEDIFEPSIEEKLEDVMNKPEDNEDEDDDIEEDLFS